MDLTEFDAHRATAAVGDDEVAYADFGEGDAALFVHGVFLNGYLWRNVVAELQDERRCIAPDLPMHGRTRVRDGADLSLAGQAALLVGLCDALRLDRVDLVANDTGGAVAQAFAANHSDRLRTLTL